MWGCQRTVATLSVRRSWTQSHRLASQIKIHRQRHVNTCIRRFGCEASSVCWTVCSALEQITLGSSSKLNLTGDTDHSSWRLDATRTPRQWTRHEIARQVPIQMEEECPIPKDEDATRYISACLRLSYLAQDRLDLVEPTKLLTPKMSEPLEFDSVPLKLAARYIVLKRKAAIRFRRQHSRRSTTGLVPQMRISTHWRKGLSVGLSLRSISMDLGIPMKVQIQGDNFTANYLTDRLGDTWTRDIVRCKNEYKTEIPVSAKGVTASTTSQIWRFGYWLWIPHSTTRWWETCWNESAPGCVKPKQFSELVMLVEHLARWMDLDGRTEEQKKWKRGKQCATSTTVNTDWSHLGDYMKEHTTGTSTVEVHENDGNQRTGLVGRESIDQLAELSHTFWVVKAVELESVSWCQPESVHGGHSDKSQKH